MVAGVEVRSPHRVSPFGGIARASSGGRKSEGKKGEDYGIFLFLSLDRFLRRENLLERLKS